VQELSEAGAINVVEAQHHPAANIIARTPSAPSRLSSAESPIGSA
jgi:hypothetical protein